MMKIVAFLSRHQALNPGNIETSLTRAVQKRRRENEGQKKKRGPPLPFPPRSCVFFTARSVRFDNGKRLLAGSDIS